MKILVTGGGGYVGCELVKSLLNDDHIVTSLDLYLYGLDVMPNHKNLLIVKGDIRDEYLLKKIFKKFILCLYIIFS